MSNGQNYHIAGIWTKWSSVPSCSRLPMLIMQSSMGSLTLVLANCWWTMWECGMCTTAAWQYFIFPCQIWAECGRTSLDFDYFFTLTTIACEASSELYTIITSEFIPSHLVLLCIECLAGSSVCIFSQTFYRHYKNYSGLLQAHIKTLTKDDHGAQPKGTSPAWIFVHCYKFPGNRGLDCSEPTYGTYEAAEVYPLLPMRGKEQSPWEKCMWKDRGLIKTCPTVKI